MSKIDDLRAGMYKSESEFVEKLATADKASPDLRTEAFARLNLIYKYASLKGRRRFLDEMTLPGAQKERKVAYDACQKSAKPQAECDALMEQIPLFLPIFDAWPKDNTGPSWWSAPLTHLVGTYDPENPPANELGGWRDQVDSPLAKGAMVAEDVAEDIGEVVGDIGGAVGDVVGDIGGSIDDAIDEQRQAVSWLKVGGAVIATAITGAVVYRIVKGA